ncbi:PTS glucose transporter subunit IIA [Microbacterium sp. NPDC089189]|uniref:PTS glucose transporter subunit IIA n=1 Tax=Microbacterium sp. NPDC089189 TaxID=3154972 RepID=UPI0034435432
MKTDAGGEILIHIGIDTVELNGQGFSEGEGMRRGGPAGADWHAEGGTILIG